MRTRGVLWMISRRIFLSGAVKLVDPKDGEGAQLWVPPLLAHGRGPARGG